MLTVLAQELFCDLQAANAVGIPVFNAPFSNTRSVAELVICEVIALARQLGDRSSELHRCALFALAPLKIHIHEAGGYAAMVLKRHLLWGTVCNPMSRKTLRLFFQCGQRLCLPDEAQNGL